MNVPTYRPRPKLDRWMRDHDLDDRGGGELFGCSHEYVRRMRLPFDDERRAVPGKSIMERVVLTTQGEVAPADFFPPVDQMLASAA